jgi:hypothetical protein
MDNLGYIVAGYGLTWLVLGWYAWRTNRGLESAARAVSEWNESDDAPRDSAAAVPSA